MIAFGLYATDPSVSRLFIANYADIYLVDALKRIKGAATCIRSVIDVTRCACGSIRSG